MPNLVEVPILGVLREQPLHGYELKRRIENLTGYFGTLSFGSLYPMLRTLEMHGCVTHKEEWQFGRIIHRYRITPKGEERFVQLMHESGVALTQKLIFFQAIPVDKRKQILLSHLEEWKSRLAKCQLEQEQADMGNVDRYRAALLARELERLDKDVVWLQKLIDEEDTSEEPIQGKQGIPRGPLKETRKRRKSNSGTKSR